LRKKPERTKKWYKSSYRLEKTHGGRVVGIIHMVRFDPEKGQVGRWYYTPAYPDETMAKARVKDTMRDLSNVHVVTSMARPFDGELSTINPDDWCWRPLV